MRYIYRHISNSFVLSSIIINMCMHPRIRVQAYRTLNLEIKIHVSYFRILYLYLCVYGENGETIDITFNNNELQNTFIF